MKPSPSPRSSQLESVTRVAAPMVAVARRASVSQSEVISSSQPGRRVGQEAVRRRAVGQEGLDLGAECRFARAGPRNKGVTAVRRLLERLPVDLLDLAR